MTASERTTVYETLRTALAIIEREAGKERMTAAARPRWTLRQLWERFVELKVTHMACPTTARGRAGHLLSHVCRDGTLLGDRDAETLTPLDVEEYRSARSKQISTQTGKPPAPGTRNREVSLLRRLLNWAARNRMITVNPLGIVDMEPENNIRETTLDDAAKDALLAACLTDLSSTNDHVQSRRKQELPSAMLYAIVLVLIDTGMRAMEALGLAWDKVDLETGKIMLGQRDTKTKQLRRPKLSSRALQALHALPRHPTSPWVFCHTGGRFDGQQWPYRTVYKWYQRAVRAAGLKGVGGERVWLHSLRHTFVKDSRARGIDPRVSMLMTGHRTMSAFTRYGFINEKETEDAWDKVDRSIKSGRTARRAAGGAR